MKKNKVWNILFFSFLFIGCQIQDKPKSNGNNNELVKEQFDAFYTKFHNDSLFQISRIKFPLPGINTDEMTVEDTTYYWKKDEWVMQHMVDTTLFSKKMLISDTAVEEEITSKDPGVIIKRKFQRIKGKWHLVLYEDVNL